MWVDALRVVVIAGVIVMHTATGYVVDIAGWYYDDELDASGPIALLLSFPAALGGLFALGPLFFVAGWFSAVSLAHHGTSPFLRSRLLRLGVPLVAFVLVVNPLCDFVGNYRQEGEPLTSYYTAEDYEVGVMWFVVALLVFSFGYAGLRRLRPRPAGPAIGEPPRVTRLLVLSALTTAVGSLVVWQWWPLTADEFMNLRVAHWPQGAVLFALGVAAVETRWLDAVSPSSRRRIGWVAAAGVAALLVLTVVELASGDFDAVMEGRGATTVLFAVLDGIIAVTGTVWLVAVLRRRSWTVPRPLLTKAGRASYATYFLHPLVVTTLMTLLAPVPGGAAVKFVLVSTVAVPACFAVGYAATRVPGLAKVL
jgi:hypothetical protein